MDITEHPAYVEGAEWANANVNRLRELFTARELATGELRTKLFDVAIRLFPSQHDSMVNDLAQTAWVAGTIRRLTDLMPFTQEAAAAVFDAAIEMGSIISTEWAKHECLEDLKHKPEAWWHRKFGAASPKAIVGLMAIKFRKSEKRLPHSPWEVLIAQAGSREMCALATLRKIKLTGDGEYVHYDVYGEEEASFEIMAKPVFHQGRIIQDAGEIVG